jgi:hypothetical protein
MVTDLDRGKSTWPFKPGSPGVSPSASASPFLVAYLIGFALQALGG